MDQELDAAITQLLKNMENLIEIVQSRYLLFTYCSFQKRVFTINFNCK
jgi:hypothetical protein